MTIFGGPFHYVWPGLSALGMAISNWGSPQLCFPGIVVDAISLILHHQNFHQYIWDQSTKNNNTCMCQIVLKVLVHCKLFSKQLRIRLRYPVTVHRIIA